MILLPHLKGKQFGVFGLGRSGVATVTSLLKSGAIVFAWDDNESVIKTIQQKFQKFDTLNLHCIHPKSWKEWEKFQGLIISPGIPINFPKPHWIVELAKENKCRLSGDIEIFLEYILLYQNSTKVICVTGTNGKSTTTSLINHVLNASGFNSEVGGNIGIPVLNMEPNRDVYVLELSSFQIEVTHNLDIVQASVFLNLTPDHIDRHGTLENYANVKTILSNQTPISVIGCSSEEMKTISSGLKAPKVVLISGSEILLNGISVIENILYENSIITIPHLDMKINPITNAENIASTYAICRTVFNIDIPLIMHSMQSFQGLSHRNEFLGKIGNVIFVNDSKSTNASSSEKTLLAWKNILWILGGIDKEEGIEPLVNNSDKIFANTRRAYLIGKATVRFGKSLDGILDYVKCGNLENAVYTALKDAELLYPVETECTLLLSPICASFDQFKNFEERGESFRLFFKKLSDSNILE